MEKLKRKWAADLISHFEKREEVEDDGKPFEFKMLRLVAQLESQFADSAKQETAIRGGLKSLNFNP